MSLLTGATIGACLAWLGWLVVEQRRARRHRAALAHVVHVNGIRGKSSVSRLIDAGLRAGGRRVLTKTTGTRPRFIDVDGQERPVHRRGQASIREQLATLRRAAQQGAEVLVVECMAVLPEYQEASEERMLRADVAVITNVRPDHPEEMGADLDDVAAALALTLPTNGAAFTADAAYADVFAARAAQKGSTCALAAPCHDDPPDFAENVGLALAVCEHLGVPRPVALAGMRHYRRDPGVFAMQTQPTPCGGTLTVLNALAANDPASAAQLLAHAEAEGLFPTAPGKNQRLLLINNRYDRPARTLQFVDFALAHAARFDAFVLCGHARGLVARRLRQRGLAAERLLELKHFSDLPALLARPGETVAATVFAVGNIVGSGQERASSSSPNSTPDVR